MKALCSRNDGNKEGCINIICFYSTKKKAQIHISARGLVLSSRDQRDQQQQQQQQPEQQPLDHQLALQHLLLLLLLLRLLQLNSPPQSPTLRLGRLTQPLHQPQQLHAAAPATTPPPPQPQPEMGN